MVKLRSIVLVSHFLCFSFAALAADVTGTWTTRVLSPPWWDLWSFNFNVDGDKLAGIISVRQHDIAITDGKIDGDTISFTVKVVHGRNSVEQKYRGTVSGDEIKFKREGQFRNEYQPRVWIPTLEFTAKRAYRRRVAPPQRLLQLTRRGESCTTLCRASCRTANASSITAGEHPRWRVSTPGLSMLNPRSNRGSGSWRVGLRPPT
jgi:hypothetical protein